MIVDDEDFVTMLAQRVLADEGYRIVTARDGFQAIEIYRKLRHEIELIILDFTMPVMDGSDVFHELLLINPQVPGGPEQRFRRTGDGCGRCWPKACAVSSRSLTRSKSSSRKSGRRSMR